MALTNKIIDIAEAIRNKTNTTDKLTLDEMPSKIASIETGSAKPVLQDKSVTIKKNGTTNIVADDGYDGLNNVEVITNIEGGEEEIQYITSMSSGTIIGTPPNYLNTTHKNRATYLGFDIKITPSKKYKFIGQEGYDYRVLQVDEATATSMKNGETVPDAMFIADTGYMGTHEFEVGAVENASYLWCMCRNPKDYEAHIDLNVVVPISIEKQKNQVKTIQITENGTTTITPDEGYDGLSSVEIISKVKESATIQCIQTLRFGTITGTPPNYINRNNISRGVYMGFDIKITSGKKYKITGQSGYTYRALQTTETIMNGMKNEQTYGSENDMFIADSGYVGTNFEITAVDNANYLWLMCRNSNNTTATIVSLKTAPVYIEEL